MDSQKEGAKGSEEGCCGKGGCGCGRCGCGVKILLAVILFLLGGVIGYLKGAHCGRYQQMEMCPYTTGAPAK